jgi:hypothetical protein
MIHGMSHGPLSRTQLAKHPEAEPGHRSNGYRKDIDDLDIHAMTSNIEAIRHDTTRYDKEELTSIHMPSNALPRLLLIH